MSAAASRATRAEGPFSQPNRVRLVDEFFGPRAVDPGKAWIDVYKLLLWVDSRTGIAHCYESDKSQPGKPWYPRSLVFHDWVARQFGVEPGQLKEHVNWMFHRVIGALTQAEADARARAALETQKRLFGDERSFPVPGDDPELLEIIEPLMARNGADRPPEETVLDVLRKVYAHLGFENKRANLLGRGFEDVLEGVIKRLPQPPPQYDTQTPLEQIPGFRAARVGDKAEKVDLWIGDSNRRRILVSAKWSVRADREKQLATDVTTYVQANLLREPFEYIWITNEFDPARLVANATNITMNQSLFTAVVHICPDALRAVHHLDRPTGRNPKRLAQLLDERRIIGLADWLTDLPKDE